MGQGTLIVVVVMVVVVVRKRLHHRQSAHYCHGRVHGQWLLLTIGLGSVVVAAAVGAADVVGIGLHVLQWQHRRLMPHCPNCAGLHHVATAYW